VAVFDAAGKSVANWSTGDTKTPLRSLAVDRTGNVIITQGGDVLRFKGLSGELISRAKYGNTGSFIDRAILAPDGGTLLVGAQEAVWRYDTQGKLLFSATNIINKVSDESELNISGAIDGQGNIYLLGSFNNAVFKYSPQGKYLLRFGSDGDAPGQLRAPEAVAVDGLGRVYVSDFKGVQIFDATGRYLGLIDVEGAAFGLAVDEQNNLYVATNKPKVYKFKINMKP